MNILAITNERTPVGLLNDLIFTLGNVTNLYGDFNLREHEIIEKVQENDIFLFMPVSANDLAKFAHGLEDDNKSMLFSFLDMSEKTVVIVPMMNAFQWSSKFVDANIRILDEAGCCILLPHETENNEQIVSAMREIIKETEVQKEAGLALKQVLDEI